MEGFFLRKLCFFFSVYFLDCISLPSCSAFLHFLVCFSVFLLLCFFASPLFPACLLLRFLRFSAFSFFSFFFVSLLLWGASNSLALVGFAAEPNPRVWLIALALPWSCALLPFDWPLSASARVLFSDYFDICNSFSFFTSAVCGPLVDCIFGLRY